MRRHNDVAIILMDVVMETEHAGLDAVDTIRKKMNVWDTRIILRTGQPGQAPQRDVVTRYDINDYQLKTELTATKLFTLIYTGLSLYSEIRSLRSTKQNMRHVSIAARDIYRQRDPRALASGVLNQLRGIYRRELSNQDLAFSGLVVTAIDSPMPVVLAADGGFAPSLERNYVGAELLAEIRQLPEDSASPSGTTLIARCSGRAEHTAVVLQADADLSHPADEVLALMFGNVAVAFENSFLSQEIERTQHEMVLMLSEAIEARSLETGNHVRRVGEYCALLAKLAGLSDEDVQTLRVAAPLHDAGKIAIPDQILNKPGKHTPAEWAVMQTHAQIGEKMLISNDRPILQAAAIIAGQHHERWDGMGYPQKIAGEDIHRYGRIAAIADVFDALCSDRCYKKAWPLEDVLQLFKDERGRQFDPDLVDLFLANLDGFLKIQKQFAD